MTEKHDEQMSGQDPRASVLDRTVENYLIDLAGDERHNTGDLNAQLNRFEENLDEIRVAQAEASDAFGRLVGDVRAAGTDNAAQLSDIRDDIAGLQSRHRKLAEESQRLAAGANILAARVEAWRGDTDKDLAVLRESTDEVTGALNEMQAGLGIRVGTLEEKAARLADDLATRASVMESTIQTLDARLSEELAEEARLREAADAELAARAERLEDGTRRLNDETADLQIQLNAQSERSDRLDGQTDDLVQRADSLAAHAARLQETGEDLQMQVGVLDTRSSVLEDRTDELEDRAESAEARTARLAETADDLQHQVDVVATRSDVLEDRADSVENEVETHALKLGALGRAVSRNFRQAVAALVVVAAVLATLMLVSENRWQGSQAADQALVAADAQLRTSDAVQDRALERQSAAAAVEARRLAALATVTDKGLQEQRAALGRQQDELARQEAKIARLQADLAAVRDTARNSEGLVNALSGPRSFGRGNGIHTPDWLATREPAASVVLVGEVQSHQALYDLAHRWSAWLNEADLAYVTRGEERYVLVYGPFEDAARAADVARRLPSVRQGQKAEVGKVADLL